MNKEQYREEFLAEIGVIIPEGLEYDDYTQMGKLLVKLTGTLYEQAIKIEKLEQLVERLERL
jgi:hypothetical protein